MSKQAKSKNFIYIYVKTTTQGDISKEATTLLDHIDSNYFIISAVPEMTGGVHYILQKQPPQPTNVVANQHAPIHVDGLSSTDEAYVPPVQS